MAKLELSEHEQGNQMLILQRILDLFKLFLAWNKAIDAVIAAYINLFDLDYCNISFFEYVCDWLKIPAIGEKLL